MTRAASPGGELGPMQYFPDAPGPGRLLAVPGRSRQPFTR